MEKLFTISVGRQFGSGGRDIAQKLSELLGVSFYDKELINIAASGSGLDKSYFESSDEKSPNPFLHALSGGFLIGGGDFLYNYGGINSENIFKYQADVIEQIAEKESSVIVGRCSDYILRNNPNCTSIFICSPINVRIANVALRMSLSERSAYELIKRRDKERSSYYNFYTNKKWGDGATYHLSIDSSTLGYEETAEFVKEYIVKKSNKKC